ncbi:lipoprotein [Caballeronia hypogeia]|uniref:Lipoprotein n=1 Tax=Caballeronia hypogeia TaxID=1777140 RepID=A0A158DC31_9BURK|nr:lipoprotein [Caballeronia hypogeia]
MDSVNLEVLKASESWIDAGHRVLLVTVVKTWGSSPRPEGSMLAVRDDDVGIGRLRMASRAERSPTGHR